MDSPSGWTIKWYTIGISLSLIAASITFGIVFYPPPNCEQETARSPEIDFSANYSDVKQTLTISHVNGDTLNENNTMSLKVVVLGDNGKITYEVSLFSYIGQNFTISPETSWMLRNFSMQEGSTIRIIWSEKEDSPIYCPNSGTATAVLEQFNYRSGSPLAAAFTSPG